VGVHGGDGLLERSDHLGAMLREGMDGGDNNNAHDSAFRFGDASGNKLLTTGPEPLT
jgi:hypothetical protein